MKKFIYIHIISIFLFTLPPIAALASEIDIVSGTSWKSHNVYITGWEVPDFDDSTWLNAGIYSDYNWCNYGYKYPYPATNWWPGTAAEHMWDVDFPNIAYFRKTFTLNFEPTNALARIRGDDAFRFYVNGVLVDSYTVPEQGSWGRAHEVDITPFLNAGNNVFAIEAWNIIGCGRSIIFDADILIEKIDVEIDIKPGSYPNCFNINDHGVIPVAVLGSEEFEVTTIDILKLSFGGLNVRIRGKKGPMCHLEDVSGDFANQEGEPDGFLDLVCQFEDDSEQWLPGDDTADLTGALSSEFGEIPILGSDSICVKP